MKEEHTHRLFELILAHAEGAKVKPIEVFREVNAVEIPENATNGDVIKALFPQMGVNEDWKATRSGQILSKDKKYVDISFACTSDWWNAPYKKGSEDKE